MTDDKTVVLDGGLYLEREDTYGIKGASLWILKRFMDDTELGELGIINGMTPDENIFRWRSYLTGDKFSTHVKKTGSKEQDEAAIFAWFEAHPKYLGI